MSKFQRITRTLKRIALQKVYNMSSIRSNITTTRLIASAGLLTGVSFLLTLAKNTTLIPILHASESDKTGLRQQFNFVDKIVNQCAPSVVFIEIKDSRRIDPQTGQALTTSNGSGFLIRDDGWILTNAHVVINKPSSVIMVMMQDGSTYQAVLEDADLNLDLALIKVYSDEKFPYLRMACTNDASVGEWVVAMGSPLSLSHSVTVGVISSISRTAEDLGLRNHSMKYIQTDASITFGNSGGPLINLDGNVIGINNLRITSGISFAIPIEYAQRFLENGKLAPHSKITGVSDLHCIGITTFSVTPQLIRELMQRGTEIPENLENGVLIWKVLQGSSADKSGLTAGDIVTHVNGAPIREASDIYVLDHNKRGSKLNMDIWRGGKRKQIVVIS